MSLSQLWARWRSPRRVPNQLHGVELCVDGRVRPRAPRVVPLDHRLPRRARHRGLVRLVSRPSSESLQGSGRFLLVWQSPLTWLKNYGTPRTPQSDLKFSRFLSVSLANANRERFLSSLRSSLKRGGSRQKRDQFPENF